MEPRIIEDESIEREVGLISEMCEGVVVKRRLEGVVGVFYSFDTHKFRILCINGDTDL